MVKFAAVQSAEPEHDLRMIGRPWKIRMRARDDRKD
jgi:hypothetical protein